MRDTGNVCQVNAVAEPPRRRAVDQRVARGLDAAVQEVRQQLAQDDASATDKGSIRDDDEGLPPPQIRFLAAMRQRPSVGCAMRMAGVRFANLRQWRKSARFRELEQESLEHGKARLFVSAWKSAVEGDVESVYQGGRCVGCRRRYSDRMREILLKALFPELFDRGALAGQPARRTIILGTTEEIADVVRRLSPTGRRIERPIMSDGSVSA